jgi:ribosomal protein S1
VVKVASFGLVVMIGGKVRAICPTMHLTDASGTQAVTQLHKRFKPSQKLTMRVWEVKDDAIVMTNKKSIVQAEEKSIIKNMDEVVVGKTAFGIVSKISQFGLQIHFFNKVKGDIPMSVLVKQGVTGDI